MLWEGSCICRLPLRLEALAIRLCKCDLEPGIRKGENIMHQVWIDSCSSTIWTWRLEVVITFEIKPKLMSVNCFQQDEWVSIRHSIFNHIQNSWSESRYWRLKSVCLSLISSPRSSRVRLAVTVSSIFYWNPAQSNAHSALINLLSWGPCGCIIRPVHTNARPTS